MRQLLLSMTAIAMSILYLNAQSNYPIVVSGLNQPVGVEVDQDGVLWVAEIGTGQNDGAITKVLTNGEHHRVITNLPSFFNPESNETTGPLRAVPMNDNLLAVHISEVEGEYASTILVFDLNDLTDNSSSLSLEDVKNKIDVGDFSTQLFPESNPYSFVHDGCDMYIADAAANAIIKRDGLTGVMSVFAEFPPFSNPLPFGPPFVDVVPTGIVAKSDGGFLVASLTGFPFATGAAKIYEVDMDGNVSVFSEGHTLLTDLKTFNDDLYALQYAVFDGQAMGPPFLFNSATLNKINTDGTRESMYEGFGPSAGFTRGSDGHFYATQFFQGNLIRLNTADDVANCSDITVSSKFSSDTDAKGNDVFLLINKRGANPSGESEIIGPVKDGETICLPVGSTWALERGDKIVIDSEGQKFMRTGYYTKGSIYHKVVRSTEPGEIVLTYRKVKSKTMSKAISASGNPSVEILGNPTNSSLILNVTNSGKNNHILLVSESGKLLRKIMLKEDSGRNQKFQIDLDDFPTGVYFIHANFEGKEIVEKFMKI